MINAEKSDLFDVLAYIAFALDADHALRARRSSKEQISCPATMKNCRRFWISCLPNT